MSSLLPEAVKMSPFFCVSIERNLSRWGLSATKLVKVSVEVICSSCHLWVFSLHSCLGSGVLCPVLSITWSSCYHSWTLTSHCTVSSRSCLCRLSWSLWSLQPGDEQMKHSQQRRKATKLHVSSKLIWRKRHSGSWKNAKESPHESAHVLIICMNFIT